MLVNSGGEKKEDIVNMKTLKMRLAFMSVMSYVLFAPVVFRTIASAGRGRKGGGVSCQILSAQRRAM